MSAAAPGPEVPGLRAVRDADRAGLTALIGGCFAEYPGCVLDLPGIDAWLQAPATSYAEHGGELWVVERDGRIVACVGYRPQPDGSVELKSLYVGAPGRRRGLGSALIRRVEAAAAALAAPAVTLWTDTRFTDAHRLYESHGYRRQPGTRHLYDPSDTTEYQYRKPG